MLKIIVIAHDIRSAHNVGALLRTADGLGIDQVILSGYTPRPKGLSDDRLPHIANKVHGRIAKTSLGAENSVNWNYAPDINSVIDDLKTAGTTILALEQASDSISLPEINKLIRDKSFESVAILLGSEVDGVSQKLLAKTEYTIEIPMFGKKESYNVVEAATMAMYQLRLVK